MKTAIVSHNVIEKGSGQGKVTCELIKYLLGKGYFVDLYGETVDKNLIKNDKMKFFIIKVPKRPAIVRNILFVIIINLKLRSIRLKNVKYYDIIHIDSGCTTGGFWDISTCHYCHSSSKKYENGIYHKFCAVVNSWIEKRMYKNLIYLRHRGIKKAEKDSIVIVVSKRLKEDLKKYVGLNSEKINLIHNGIDFYEFNTDNRVIACQELLKSYNLGRNDFIMLFVGDLIKRKGIDLLLSAMKQMPSDIKLLIAGHKKRVYINKVKNYGIEKSVEFIGFQSDIAKIYKGVDAFIMPSLYDTFGNVTLEAMACGTPAIVSKFAGSSEVVIDGTNGLIFGNFNELVKKIKLLYTDKILYKSICINARETAIKYSWTDMAISVEKLYLSIYNKNN